MKFIGSRRKAEKHRFEGVLREVATTVVSLAFLRG